MRITTLTKTITSLELVGSPAAIVLLTLLIFKLGITTSSTLAPESEPNDGESESPAVTRLRTYLRFRTEHPHPDEGYAESIRWLKGQAEDIGLNFTVHNMEPPNQFAVCFTWVGTNPELKSVLLNSHLDVVPAEASKWKYPPFAAHKDSEGRIFARGAADMKSKIVAELEALRRLKLGGFQPLRTIHMTVVPDEEILTERGMASFVKTEFFQKLNVGVDIDEGVILRNSTKTIPVTVAEKNRWVLNITVHGKPEHSSFLSKHTVLHRLQVIINRLMEFRQTQYDRIVPSNSIFPWENLTTINLVGLGGFTAMNVIPSAVWAAFDMRIAVEESDSTLQKMDDMLNRIVKEAQLGSTSPDERVTIDFVTKTMVAGRTPTDDSNPWWGKLQNVCRELEITCQPVRANGNTDGRFVRKTGIPVFGISTIPEYNFHGDNEYIYESDFLAGIDIYEKMIRSFGMEIRKDI